jgi:hypothetical protein
MKIKGQKIKGSHVEICVIPRGEDQPDYVFKACAVLNMDEFERLCPAPKPPFKILKGGIKNEDVESPIYKGQMETYENNRFNYLILKSLEATEDLEWETVSMSDPNTWKNFRDELTESGFSNIEVGRIIRTVMQANCLDEDKIEKARNRFFLGQQDQDLQKTSSSPNGELNSMPSGEVVKE